MICSTFGAYFYLMKFLKIFLFFLILSFSAFASDSAAVFKRWSIGINGSPDYCYRRLVMGGHNNATYNLANYKNSNEQGMFAYTGGMNVAYALNKSFAISLGLNYSQKGFQTTPIDVVSVSAPETSIGKATYRYNYNYVSIPVKAHFIYGKKKIRLSASAGITSAFLIYQQTLLKINYNDGTNSTKKGVTDYIYNPFNLFMTVGVGTDIKLGKKMGLKVEPTYNYGFFRVLDGSIHEYLWDAGLNVGCYIKL